METSFLVVSQHCSSSGLYKGNKTAIGPNREDLTDDKNTTEEKWQERLTL